jgi:hypothetical protein
MKKITLFIVVVMAILSCKEVKKAKDFATDFVTETETAHLKTDFLKNDAIQYNIVAFFGAEEWINGKMTLSTNSENGKIEFKNGSQIIFNGQKVFYSNDIKDNSNVRFDAYTIPYFFLLPYKLSDKGTVWSSYQNNEKDSLNFNVKKLSFAAETGDAPNDWYVVYANKKTNLIEKAAYIVTAGGTAQAEAEKNPHAIEYLDYKITDGIPIASKWKFWSWKKDIGFEKELGNAQLSDLKFIKTDKDFFKPSSNFLEMK